MTRTGQQLVGLLWRWHRRTGVIIFLAVIVLVITGVVLNHSSTLGLDRRYVNSDWLSGVYGDHAHEMRSYMAGDRWLTRTVDGRVYVNGKEASTCRGELVGAIASELGGQDILLAACEEELLLLSTGGELIEALSESTGLPTPINGIGKVEDQIVIKNARDWRVVDMDALDFSQPVSEGALIQQQATAPLPETLRAGIPSPAQWLTWERVFLDLHSGRLFGRAGVLVMDAVAILLACIACSGLAMWWLRRRRHRR